MNGALPKQRPTLKNDRMRSFQTSEEDSFVKRRRQTEKIRAPKSQRVKLAAKVSEVASRTHEEKRELDISKGISDMLVSYEPDFGYEERIDFASMPDPNNPGQQLTQHCSGWTMLLDVISRYPRFERAINVLEKLKKEKAKLPQRRKTRRNAVILAGKREPSPAIIYGEEDKPTKEEERLRSI